MVAVVHVDIRRMATSYGCNTVPTRLRARDSTVAIVIILLQRSRVAGSWGLTCLGTLSVSISAASLTHDAIAIAVSHVGIGGMVTMHRGNAVRARRPAAVSWTLGQVSLSAITLAKPRYGIFDQGDQCEASATG